MPYTMSYKELWNRNYHKHKSVHREQSSVYFLLRRVKTWKQQYQKDHAGADDNRAIEEAQNALKEMDYRFQAKL